MIQLHLEAKSHLGFPSYGYNSSLRIQFLPTDTTPPQNFHPATAILNISFTKRVSARNCRTVWVFNSLPACKANRRQVNGKVPSNVE